MFRKLILFATTAAVLAAPAYAIDERRYTDLSKVNCDDSQTIADMEEAFLSMGNKVDGRNEMGPMEVLRSRTIQQTATELRCSVYVRFPNQTGTKARANGTFSLKLLGGGDYSLNFRMR